MPAPTIFHSNDPAPWGPGKRDPATAAAVILPFPLWRRLRQKPEPKHHFEWRRGGRTRAPVKVCLVAQRFAVRRMLGPTCASEAYVFFTRS